MQFTELTHRECYDVLRRAQVGRLGCSKDDQPYVVPVHFACDGGDVYGAATVGRKVV